MINKNVSYLIAFCPIFIYTTCNTTVALPAKGSKNIKRGEMIEYDMTSTKSIPCKIKVVSSFGY